jgi:hypothetical protein|nr:MAG TPA: hypothetical protein [Caudoviricetes sp.]
MGEYADFISKYFPLSGQMENEETLYRLICESNLISRIMLKYMDMSIEYVDQEKLIFYRRFRDGINKVLLYLPLNEEIGICACMRYSVEQFLKFIYAIYFEKDIEKIVQTSYRHIKDDVKKNNVIPEKVKTEFQKMYTYYAKYSNNVHAKEIDDSRELISLGRIVGGENEYAVDIEKDLRDILNISYEVMQSIFGVKFESLNTSERMNISNLQSKKRRKKICEILGCDD